MATSRIKISHAIDENASRLNVQLKNKATLSEQSNLTTAEPQRRIALGGLTNQLQPKNVINAKPLKQTLKEVKPKVDTHWKRNDQVAVKKSAITVVSRTERVISDAVKSTAATTSHLVADAVKKATTKCNSSITAVRPGGSFFRKFHTAASIDAADPLSHSSKQLAVAPHHQQQHDDIDSMDADNPFLISEYVCDIYAYLQRLEQKYPVAEGFLDQHEEISARMRSVLIDWINEVHFQFKLLPETYFMAVGLIDQYLQRDRGVARKNLQLVGAAALFVAAKFEELYPPVLADFVYITDNTYSERQVIEMEKHMLSTLKFELCRPVAIQFLRRYSKAAVSETITHTLAKYFIELATVDYHMSHHCPSLTSAAALYLSLIVLKTKTSLAEMRFTDFWTRGSSSSAMSRSSPQSVQLWTANLAYYSSYSETRLRPVVKKLAALVLMAPKSKPCRSIYNKYSMPKFEKCAQLPELSGSLIKTLATEVETTLEATTTH